MVIRKELALATPITVDAAARNQIEKISREIAWYEEQTNQTLRLALQYKLEIGKRLMRIKCLLPHGQFLDWARQEFGWTPKHIQNHLTLAANAKLVSELPTGASLRMALATIKQVQSSSGVPRDESNSSPNNKVSPSVRRLHVIGEIEEGTLDCEQLLNELGRIASKLRNAECPLASISVILSMTFLSISSLLPWTLPENSASSRRTNFKNS